MSEKYLKFGKRIALVAAYVTICIAFARSITAQLCCGPEIECDRGEIIDPYTCECHPGTPIIVDVLGEGFHLTSLNGGVWFDIRGDGRKVRIAWTEASFSNGFLVLDRNNNGTIDNGTELFGNSAAQPASTERNGFLALAEFDKPENGGNMDGSIDGRDAIYPSLRIWIDRNHDGRSQPEELSPLPAQRVFSIALDYSDLERRDRYGNIFRYRAKVNGDSDAGPSYVGRWAYDVFLMSDE